MATGAIAVVLQTGVASFGFGRANEVAWQGVVVDKSRGMFDGSNMYHRVKIRVANGDTKKVRVGRSLWKSLAVGDILIKAPGSGPVREAPGDPESG